MGVVGPVVEKGVGVGKPRGETKIVYREGSEIRAVRGVLIAEDGHFLTLMRRGGTLRVAKDIILKIEEVSR